MSPAEILSTVRSVAGIYGIDPSLVLAVATHESSLNPWAVRYEPAFYTRYIQSMTGLTDTEKTMRATSFGLMQVMGQVAREKGFSEKYLTALCEPISGLTYGCKKLKECLDHTKNDVRAALLRYNGGADPHYPDLVLKHYKEEK